MSTDCFPLVCMLISLHANSKACMRCVIRSRPRCVWLAVSALCGSLPPRRGVACIYVIIVVKKNGIMKTDEARQYRQCWVILCGGYAAVWDYFIPGLQYPQSEALLSAKKKVLHKCQMCSCFLFFLTLSNTTKIFHARLYLHRSCLCCSTGLQTASGFLLSGLWWGCWCSWSHILFCLFEYSVK